MAISQVNYTDHMPTIRVEDDVFEGLKELAEPFVDTPSSVIRTLLEEKGILKRASAATRAPAPKSNASSELTPQSVFEQFLLFVLDEDFKGKGDKRSVTQTVVERMSKRGMISAADLEFVSTGETKAENTISWGRNARKDRGLISDSSARGIWELTPEGRAAAKTIQLPIRKTA